MRADSRENFRKWATLIVATVGLLVTCLRDPIVLTLKSTIKEVIREEMDRYENPPFADARGNKQNDADAELRKRMDQEIAAIRELATRSTAEHNTWLHVQYCLAAIEAKLDALDKAQSQDSKRQRDRN